MPTATQTERGSRRRRLRWTTHAAIESGGPTMTDRPTNRGIAGKIIHTRRRLIISLRRARCGRITKSVDPPRAPAMIVNFVPTSTRPDGRTDGGGGGERKSDAEVKSRVERLSPLASVQFTVSNSQRTSSSSPVASRWLQAPSRVHAATQCDPTQLNASGILRSGIFKILSHRSRRGTVRHGMPYGTVPDLV